MQYNSNKQFDPMEGEVYDDQSLPTIASEIPIGAPPLLDGKLKLDCDSNAVSEPGLVKDEIQLIFSQSDYTWLIFVSRPVRVQCVTPAKKEAPAFVPGQPAPSSGVVFGLQFLDDDDTEDMSDLVVRVALMNDCTYGANPMTCGRGSFSRDQTELGALLRKHKDLYPGPDSDLEFEFLANETTSETSAARIKFNWNVQSMTKGEIFDDNIDNTLEVLGATKDAAVGDDNKDAESEEEQDPKLLMYALPHHQDMIESATASDKENHETSFPMNADNERFCRPSLIGPACLVKGSTWNLREDFSSRQLTSFRAPRPPQNDTLPALSKALKKDLKFEIPVYFMRGAGDTVCLITRVWLPQHFVYIFLSCPFSPLIS